MRRASGAGTLATYGSKGDVYRFYDINPAVVGIAHHYFTYLDDSDATIEVVLGDARLNLERVCCCCSRRGVVEDAPNVSGG